MNALSQFALVTMLVLAVPAVVGWQVTRPARVSTAVLLFYAVPLAISPPARRLDGGLLTRPSPACELAAFRTGGTALGDSANGDWEFEACSGVRYLIASITVGTL